MVDEKDLPELAAVFKTAIAAHMAPLQAEIAVLKARLDDRPAPKDGAPGRDGKDATAPVIDYDFLLKEIAFKVKEAAAAIPAPINGKDGAPGRDGINGKDAPAVDLDAIVRRAVELIPAPVNGIDGKDGAPGIAGKDGANGLDGKDGAAGRDGKDGALGLNGKDGAPGDKGRDGRDGRDGDAGIPGKDAAEIQPLHGMDESASYQVGTWVAHRNGLFRAYRATDPVKGGDYAAAGWSLIWGGVADIRGELAADQRTFLQTIELSDGKSIVSRTKLPTPLHRGVYREGLTYERGDFVQWGGNLWHANETTTEKPIEGAKAWSLAARRGRDGKTPGGTTE